MKGKETAASVLSRVQGYLLALGTFLIGGIGDFLILVAVDVYTPTIGLLTVLYSCYRVYTYQVFMYTPPKGSVHLLVEEDEYSNLYEMFSLMAPKGVELRIFRSIGLDCEYSGSIEKNRATIYISEDVFLRLNQNSKTRSVGGANIIDDAVTKALYNRPVFEITWMAKLSDIADATGKKFAKENGELSGAVTKAAIAGGLLAGGTGAVVAGSSVGAAKAGARGPAAMLLLLLIAYGLYILAVMLIILPVNLCITLPLSKKVKHVASSGLGRTKDEIKQSWKRAEAQMEESEGLEVDFHDAFYQVNSGWKPMYDFDFPETATA